ncbi:MAG: hypothetical protein ACKVJG_16245 [Candidatus Latescibacterota bacterium]
MTIKIEALVALHFHRRIPVPTSMAISAFTPRQMSNMPTTAMPTGNAQRPRPRKRVASHVPNPKQAL